MNPKTFSQRILAVRPSPTIALNSQAAALAKEGKPVVSFAVGEPDFRTPEPIRQAAIQSLLKDQPKYGSPGGGPALREAISRKLKKENSLEYSPSQIVVGIGAKELLFHAFLALLNEGDEVILPSPCWVSYADQVTAAGGVAKFLPLPVRIDEEPISIEEIERLATDRTRAIILNSPNNPAGYVLSKEAIERLGTLLRKKEWWILTDEIYEYLAFDRPHISLLNLFPDLADRTIYFNGLSKSFSMTGWRVGYAAGPQKAMDLIRSLQSHSSTCLPTFVEAAAIVAVESGRPLVEKEIIDLNEKRKFTVELLSQVPNLDWVTPQGAFYIFLDLRKLIAPFTRIASSFQLCEWLLKEYHLVIVPGEAFGAPGFARMTYAASRESIQSGVERLTKAAQALIN